MASVRLCEVGSIKAFPLPVADEGNALMAQWPEIRRAPLAGVCLDSGATSVAPSIAVVKRNLADHLSFARCPKFESPMAHKKNAVCVLFLCL